MFAGIEAQRRRSWLAWLGFSVQGFITGGFPCRAQLGALGLLLPGLGREEPPRPPESGSGCCHLFVTFITGPRVPEGRRAQPRAGNPGCSLLGRYSCCGVKSREGCREPIATLGALGAFPPLDFEQEEKLLLAVVWEPGWKLQGLPELWQQRGTPRGFAQGEGLPRS